MKGVLLAAGEGTRLRPLTFSIPKPVISIMGKPLAFYGVEKFKELGIREVVIVVGALAEVVKSYFGNGWNGFSFKYVVQPKRLGIAHAIHLAISSASINEDFLVYLGDNVVLDPWPEKLKEVANFSDAVIFLAEVPNPSRFGVAIIKDGKVTGFVEKPKVPPSNLVLTGIYYFKDPEDYEKCYSTLKPSWRGEYEITDIINCYLKSGKEVKFVKISGWWKDAGKPEDLLDVMIMLMDYYLRSPRIEGEVSGMIKGNVIIEKGAVVEGTVYGPAYIGKGAIVKREAVVEHYVDLEAGALLKNGSLSRSLILEESELELGRSRLVDSIVGPRSLVKLSKENRAVLSLILSQQSKVVEL